MILQIRIMYFKKKNLMKFSTKLDPNQMSNYKKQNKF